MRIDIVYGTVEGQTRKIARHIGEALEAEGHEAPIHDAADLADYEPEEADAVVVCAPIHAGRYPSAVTHWLKKNSATLNERPSAFISVSMAAASKFDAEHSEIQKIAEHFLEGVGWHPALVHQAAGALRFSEYDFFKRMLMRYIVHKEDSDLDLHRDHEFTDWAKLDGFVTELSGHCRERQAGGPDYGQRLSPSCVTG